MIIKILILLWFLFCVSSQSIVNTVHNLSVSGAGEIKAVSESEICIFCHTPWAPDGDPSPLHPVLP